MKHNIITVALAFAAGMIPAGIILFQGPKQVIVQPQTVVRAENVKPGKVLAMWGDLDQKEVDAVTEAIKSLPKTKLVIFCDDKSLCGDMAMDFENSFESAKWNVKVDRPAVGEVVGLAASRKDLVEAINKATANRLNAFYIPKNSDDDFLAIGRKK